MLILSSDSNIISGDAIKIKDINVGWYFCNLNCEHRVLLNGMYVCYAMASNFGNFREYLNEQNINDNTIPMECPYLLEMTLATHDE